MKKTRPTERTDEQTRTNNRQNRTFIDHVLDNHDEQAIKNLFEEYFQLHAEQYKQNRITWAEFQFIVQEIFQNSRKELTLHEAKNLFYQIYQSQYTTNSHR